MSVGGEGVKKRISLCVVGGNVNWHSHSVKQCKFLKNLKMELIHHPAIPPWRYIRRKWNHHFKQLSASPCSLQHYFMVAVAQTVKNLPAMQETQVQSLEDPLPGREWLTTPVFLPGEFHGQRSLVGYTVLRITVRQTE